MSGIYLSVYRDLVVRCVHNYVHVVVRFRCGLCSRYLCCAMADWVSYARNGSGNAFPSSFYSRTPTTAALR